MFAIPWCVPLIGGVSEILQLRKVPIQLRLWDGRQSLSPALTGILRSRADDQKAVLDRNGNLGSEATCLQELFWEAQSKPVADFFDLRLPQSFKIFFRRFFSAMHCFEVSDDLVKNVFHM